MKCFYEWMYQSPFLLHEVSKAELVANGYIFMQSIKYGPQKGKSGYWHPETKDIIPAELIDDNRPVNKHTEDSKIYFAAFDLRKGPDEIFTVRRLGNGFVEVGDFQTGVLGYVSPAEAARYYQIIKKSDGKSLYKFEKSGMNHMYNYFMHVESPKNQFPVGNSIQSNQSPENFASKYVAGTVIYDGLFSLFKKGDDVAVFRNHLGQYELYAEDGTSATIGEIELKGHVASLKNKNGETLEADSLKELFEKLRDKEALGFNLDYKSEAEKLLRSTVRPSQSEVRLPPEFMNEFNQKIEDKFNGTKDDIMIDALAGTGKTTMLKHLSSFLNPGERCLYVVFNKKNQLESQYDFPKGVDVMTSHSFLGLLLNNADKDLNIPKELNSGSSEKLKKIADHYIPLDWPKSRHTRVVDGKSPFHNKAKKVSIAIAEKAKANAVNLDKDDIEEKIRQIINSHSINMDVSADVSIDADEEEETIPDRLFYDDIVKMATKLLEFSLPKQSPDNTLNFTRDQDDTLWYAALYADKINWKIGYDVVLLDEVQDFNNCQLIMATKLKEAGCRIIAVGDKNQSMYHFRGADSDAFDKLKKIVSDEDPYSLPINFRSGENIIAYVRENTHVTSIQSSDRFAGMGKVFAENGTDPPVKQDDFVEMLTNEMLNSGRLKMSTVIISRNNAPLMKIAMHFFKNNINFEFVGRDLSSKFNDILKKTKAKKVEINALHSHLSTVLEALKEKYKGKDHKESEIEEIEEHIVVMGDILKYLETDGYKASENSEPLKNGADFMVFLKNKLDNMSKKMPNKEDQTSYVSLVTSHRSKGLEWDRVYLLTPEDYEPSKTRQENEEQLQQKKNGLYVAMTRAKKELYIGNVRENENK